MAKIIAVYNRKGGVGKTTSLLNLGAEFALLGKKVLLVDGDSQMNLTQYFFSDELDIEIGIDPSECILSQGRTKPGVENLYTVLEDKIPVFNAIRTIERSTKRKFGNRFKTVSCKFDVLLGSREMDCYEINDIESVKKLLSQAEDEYDYIFIDFPPQNSLVTMMYLVASDYLIAPLHLGKESSLFAYNDIIDCCEEAINSFDNKNLVRLGAFYTQTQLYKGYQKEKYTESMTEEMRQAMRFFKTTIKYDYATTTAAEAYKEPVCISAGRSEIAKNYKDLAKEILQRIKEVEQHG